MKTAHLFENMKNTREKMVKEQIITRGITDERIVNAFLRVPREYFVPKSMMASAYNDNPLPIGDGQTISQPYIVARMLELLELTGKEKVLEIGTGSGYLTALLCECAHIVYSMDRIEKFVKQSREVLDMLGYFKAHLIAGDGSMGYYTRQPYDRIIVSAAAPRIPAALSDQLNEGGILIIPIGDMHQQRLIKAVKKNGIVGVIATDGCTFVPLIGEQGWESSINTP